MTASDDPRPLLEFWFSDFAKPLHFKVDAGFDEELRRRFGAQQREAADGRLAQWERDPDSALALVLLLDQLPRNLYRRSPRAFATDAMGLATAERAIARGFDAAQPADRRWFFYLPFEHSEKPADQARAVELFRAWAAPQFAALTDTREREELERHLWFVERHREIIERFGRFPHRNEALGRPSTEEELAFLKEPHSGF
jgi:uncharacterized protein (DUF924 family)